MNKREEAYDFIRRRILDATLGRGSTTSEREIEALAQADGRSMSRTPIREALAVLAATGLIEQLPQVGARVRTIDATEAVRTLRLRRGMEEVMVEELASHEHPDVGQIQQAIQRMSEAVDDDPTAFQLADTEFHVEIALAAGYFSARTSLEGLRDRIHVYRLDSGLDGGAAHATLNEHYVILENIAARNRDGAVAALNEHLAASAARIAPGLESDTFQAKPPMEVIEEREVAIAASAARTAV
jgi:DNA-binding GntR family transcriptional regulator